MSWLYDVMLTPAIEVGDIKITAFQVVAVLVLVGLFWFQHSSRGGKSCTARHILMKTEEELLKAKSRIDAGRLRVQHLPIWKIWWLPGQIHSRKYGACLRQSLF
eukprot:TRINITY_DN112123_c0_g1_i1.p2 TRINITY_DN112123_c0_g1~~TRINITY_DN112123_c0_g1_i1.p2  ORF type:complete len:104 (-),score=19.56 TRINITY_DN112123_c0_g1_i1:235-546(-)